LNYETIPVDFKLIAQTCNTIFHRNDTREQALLFSTDTKVQICGCSCNFSPAEKEAQVQNYYICASFTCCVQPLTLCHQKSGDVVL